MKNADFVIKRVDIVIEKISYCNYTCKRKKEQEKVQRTGSERVDFVAAKPKGQTVT